MGIQLGAGAVTRDRLDACLDALHWSRASLARMTGYSERQMRRWEEVPQPVATWLERRLKGHTRDPAPKSPSINRRTA